MTDVAGADADENRPVVPLLCLVLFVQRMPNIVVVVVVA
jgi:hypothetical protein